MEEALDNSKKFNVKEMYKGKWLKFKVVEYLTQNGSTNAYEYIERTTSKGGLDGTYIVGILRFPKTGQQPKLILEANFRPPVQKYVLEFPAGLTETEDDCLGDAVRELQEETGFTASKVLDILPIEIMPQVSPTLH